HFTHQPSVGEPMIPMAGARLPEGFLPDERVGHCFPLVDNTIKQLLAHCWGTRTVTPQHIHPYLRLVRPSELSPLLWNRYLQVQKSLVHKSAGADGGHTLGRGVDGDDSIALPGTVRVLVDDPSPEVHHWRAIDGHGDSSADLAELLEVLRECVTDRSEPRIALPMELH